MSAAAGIVAGTNLEAPHVDGHTLRELVVGLGSICTGVELKRVRYTSKTLVRPVLIPSPFLFMVKVTQHALACVSHSAEQQQQ